MVNLSKQIKKIKGKVEKNEMDLKQWDRKIVQYRVTTDKGIKRKDLNEFLNAFRESAKKSKGNKNNNIDLSVVTHDEVLGWKSAGFRDLDKNLSIYNPFENYDFGDKKAAELLDRYGVSSFDDLKYNRLDIYARATPKMKEEGGCSPKYNDCLHRCLKKALGTYYKLSPSGLKKFLGLERADKVHVDLISRLEDKLKTKIDIEGDSIYVSDKGYTRSLVLQLKNGHYTVYRRNRKDNSLIRNKKIECDKLVVYNTRYYYDGESIKEKPKDKIYNIVPNCIHFRAEIEDLKKAKIEDLKKAKIEDLKKAEIEDLKKAEIEDLKKEHEQLLYEITELKKRDKDLDFFKYGTKARIALSQLHKLSPMLGQPDPIGQLEAIFNKNALSGALMYAEQYEGYGYEYDLNGMYMAYLKSEHFKFPVKAGKFMTIDKIDEYPKRGIYRAKVEGNNKFFRYNKNHTYYSYDIQIARELNLKVELIQDGKYNFLYYEHSTLMKGKDAFEDFVDKFENLRHEDKKYKRLSKAISRCLWGALCEQRRSYKSIDEGTEYNVGYGQNITDIIPREGGYFTRVQDLKKKFKLDYARVSPMLLSYARLKMIKHLKPFLDKVVYIHTDGFVSTEDVSQHIPISRKLGEWKKEKEGEINIRCVGAKTFKC